MDYDFQIITLPRSGSHMLASALNSHPDISCSGEILNIKDFIVVGDKKLRGGIVHFVDIAEGDVQLAPKVIYLSRDVTNRAKSIDNMRQIKPKTTEHPYHFLEPAQMDTSKVVYHKETIDVAAQRQQLLETFLVGKDHIEITYEELTNNQNIDIIPEAIARKITDYLGVNYTLLIPITVKPTYI